MRHILLLAAFGLGAAHAATAADFAPVPLIRQAVDQTRAMAFRTRDVDWTRVEGAMRAAAAQAHDQVDMLPAYEILVESLGDHHSFVNVSGDTRKAFRDRYGREFDAARYKPGPVSPYIARREIAAADLPAGKSKARLLVVPMLLGGGAKATGFAQTLYDAATASPPVCGYIVDLRGNQGGNEWPMIAGLAALLGDGPNGNMIDRKGRKYSYVALRDGAVKIADGEQAGLTIVSVEHWRPTPRLAGIPVAILIDQSTASSGAGAAIAFKGRPHSRFFGSRSSPTVSANDGFVLADGTNIVVTTDMMADRDWHIYPEGLTVDEQIASGTDGDHAKTAALAWLGRQPGCRNH